MGSATRRRRRPAKKASSSTSAPRVHSWPAAAKGGEIAAVLAGVRQRRHDLPFGQGAAAGMPAGEGGERAARTDLEQDRVFIFEEALEPGAETHRLAQVAGPGGGIGGRRGEDPVAGGVRQVRNARRPRRGAGDQLGELAEGGLHAARVEGVRGVQAAAFDAAPPELFGKTSSAASGPATTRSRGPLAVASERSAGRSGASSDSARVSASMPPGGSAATSLPRPATRARAASRSNTPATAAATYSPMLWPSRPAGSMPQLRHNAASDHSTAAQRGLRQLGGLQPFGGVRAGGEDELAQVEPEVGQEDLAAGVEFAAEHGFAAVDLGGHAGMLRALAGKRK